MSNINIRNFTPLDGEGGRISISGSLHVKNDITLGGHIDLGDSAADSIKIVAEISSSIIPDADKIYDLGSSVKEWDTVNAGTASLGRLFVGRLRNSGSVGHVGALTPINFDWFLTSSIHHKKGLNPANIGTVSIWDNQFHHLTDEDNTIMPNNEVGYGQQFYVGNELLSQISTEYAGATGLTRTHFMVTSSGYVGIGTPQPNLGTLHISQSLGGQDTLYIDGNTSGQNILPITDNIYDLGSTSKQWKELHATSASLAAITLKPGFTNINVSGSTVFQGPVTIQGDTVGVSGSFTVLSASNVSFTSVDSDLIPNLNNIVDLGSVSNQWNTLHVKSASLARINPKPGFGSIEISGSTIFENTATFQDDVTFNGSILGQSTMSISFISGGSPVTFEGDVQPAFDDTFNLGSETLQWNELHATSASIAVIEVKPGHESLMVSGSVQFENQVTIATAFGDQTNNNTASFTVGAGVGGEQVEGVDDLSIIKFHDLPTSETEAAYHGSGSIWQSGSADPGATRSARLYIFTG